MDLNDAISNIGGVSALASAVGVSPQVVNNWRLRGQVPAKWCMAVESATKAAVTRYELRPDVFGESPVVTS